MHSTILKLHPSKFLTGQFWRYLFLGCSLLCIGIMLYLISFKSTSTDSSFSPKQNSPSQVAQVAMASVMVSLDSEDNVSDIVADAQAFHDMLSTTQQSTLQLTYTNALARKWSNLPCGTSCRNGIQLGTNLTSVQFAAAMKVIKDALSASSNNGYEEFHDMSMAEAYLHANGGGSGYDSTLRWMAFLNAPTATGPWMLQFGGHHYAANIAFNNGHVVGATPFFMGLEPKTFTYNGVSYDPLGDERDAFRALFATLSSTQLSSALISSSFSDCVMIPGETNGGASSFPSATIGQPLSALTSSQQNLALAVIQLYVGDMDSATANNVMAQYTSQIDQTYISYHGNGTSGNASSFLTSQGDYMRISGPNVWIEFSCQGGIVIQGQIHYHTVWRDRSHDYGVNLTGAAIDQTTSIAEVGVSKAIKVFPNPATTALNANLPEGVSNGIVTISDLNGNILYSNERFTGEKLNFNLESFSDGVYFLYIKDRSHFYSSRFVKKS